MILSKEEHELESFEKLLCKTNYTTNINGPLRDVAPSDGSHPKYEKEGARPHPRALAKKPYAPNPAERLETPSHLTCSPFSSPESGSSKSSMAGIRTVIFVELCSGLSGDRPILQKRNGSRTANIDEMRTVAYFEVSMDNVWERAFEYWKLFRINA